MKKRLKVWHVSNSFHYAGTDKAMALWVRHLDRQYFEASAFSRAEDGPRRLALQKAGLPAKVLGPDLKVWKKALVAAKPEILHIHRHGERDQAWTDLILLARQCGVRAIVETNVFGERRRSEGPGSPDVMGMVSAFCLWRFARWPQQLPPDQLGPFTVLYNPIELDKIPAKGFSTAERKAARKTWALPADAIVAGRLARPDLNKWPHWYLGALAKALKAEPRLHLLLMEAPAGAEREAARLGIAAQCRFIKASADEGAVKIFYVALDVLAHASRVGESFGYTLAEAMAWGIPVLVDSTPWTDNAQIELVGHEKEGLVAGRPASYTAGLLRLASDAPLRLRLGKAARAAAARFDVGPLTRSLEGVYARALQEQGFAHPALALLADRLTQPGESSLLGFGTLYRERLVQLEGRQPGKDALWAFYSRVRLYARGWASKAFKFWRWKF